MSVAVFNPLNQFIDRPKNFKSVPYKCKTSNQSQLIFSNRNHSHFTSFHWLYSRQSLFNSNINCAQECSVHEETAKNKCSPISFERVNGSGFPKTLLWAAIKYPTQTCKHIPLTLKFSEISTNASTHFRMNDLWWRKTREAIEMWNGQVLRWEKKEHTIRSCVREWMSTMNTEETNKIQNFAKFTQRWKYFHFVLIFFSFIIKCGSCKTLLLL